MTPNPILKVLSTFKRHNVRALLIGGQACIIYGAAEFSRDSDFVVLITEKNLENLKRALKRLMAKLIYVPAFEVDYLERGHACHFRCEGKFVKGLRIDIIAKLRGCDSFDKLWERRNKIKLKDGTRIDVIGLSDLAQSKKTQRDKDWLMLKRLVDNDIILNKKNPKHEQIKWWFLECRDVNILIDLARKYPIIVKECIVNRPLLLIEAVNANIERLKFQLNQEEQSERQEDIEYWTPLRKELEELRHATRIKTRQ